ncbi:hypothetical protein R1sor_004637 [Riccia sorocarpa]|uniref:LysM domain-containing protein n=1 Tax=Riccia sorocarpa TaxID=122646 RepID=A0ABD3HLJ6_9MARC
MELASSSVRPPSAQWVTEGVACFRVSDCGATHGVAASSSASSSSSKVLLFGRRKIGEPCMVKAGAARVSVSSSLTGTLGGRSHNPPGGRFCSRVLESSKSGQPPAQECWTQLEVARPSERTLKTDAVSCYLDASMTSRSGTLDRAVSGNQIFSNLFSEKLVKGYVRATGVRQAGHAAAASCGHRSTDNTSKQKHIVLSKTTYGGWNSKPVTGLLDLSLKRAALRCGVISVSDGFRSQQKGRRDIRAAAASSDYRMTYPDVPTDVIASSSYLVHEGDTLTSIAKKFQTSVPVLAQVNNLENVDLLLAGQSLLIPKAYERVPGPGVDIDEFPVPSGYELRAPHERIVHNRVGYKNVVSDGASTAGKASVQESGQFFAASVMPAAGPSFAKFAVPVLLIAPLLGFCIRCIVDALYMHMEQEEAKRQSEKEGSVQGHRPKAQRWQRVLEEDRNADEGDGADLMKEWPKDNVWNSELIGPTENIWSSEVTGVMEADATEKTREILSMEKEEEVVIREEQEEYEDLRKSYAELESSYMKFLVDSGLSKSGYWRGGVPTTTAHNGEPQ